MDFKEALTRFRQQATLDYWFYVHEANVDRLVDDMSDRGLILSRSEPAVEPEYHGEHVVVMVGSSDWLLRTDELDSVAGFYGGCLDGYETADLRKE